MSHLTFLVDSNSVVIITGRTDSSILVLGLHEGGWTANGYQIAFTSDTIHKTSSPIIRQSTQLEPNYTTPITLLNATTLLNELQQDPLLSRYSVLIIDKVELHTPGVLLLLALIKKIMKKRDSLRLILLSSSKLVDDLESYFGTFKIAVCPATTLNLSKIKQNGTSQELFLSVACADYINRSMDLINQIHEEEDAGDIKVFLTNKTEVNTLISMINDEDDYRLVAQSAQTELVEERIGIRRVIIGHGDISTEVKFSIDCGLEQLQVLDVKSRISRKVIVKCSKEKAELRREGSTKCYRLYSIDDANGVCIDATQIFDCIELVATLKAVGVDNLYTFDYFIGPDISNLKLAIEDLNLLQVLDLDGTLTPQGRQLLRFPLPNIRLKALLYHSFTHNCTEEILAVIGFLLVGNCFLSDKMRSKFAMEEGDLIMSIDVFTKLNLARKSASWAQSNGLNHSKLMRIDQIVTSLGRYIRKSGLIPSSCGNDVDSVRKCILKSYPSSIARLRPQDGRFETIHGSRIVDIHPSSCLYNTLPNYVVFTSAEETSKTFMKNLTSIDECWLAELFPLHYRNVSEGSNTR